MVINLWSGPRNVSTALMYSFAQRQDTRVLDEPLYGHYLRVSGADHPAAAEVMAAMDCDGERVVRRSILGPCDRPVRFLKQMALNAIAHSAPLNWLGGIDADDQGTVDLKLQGTAIFVDAARLYALAHGVTATGTRERLENAWGWPPLNTWHGSAGLNSCRCCACGCSWKPRPTPPNPTASVWPGSTTSTGAS
jgi:hypothetical protein